MVFTSLATVHMADSIRFNVASSFSNIVMKIPKLPSYSLIEGILSGLSDTYVGSADNILI